MNRQPLMALQLAMTCLIVLFINSCAKDQCTRTYTLYKPVYKTLTQVRAEMKSMAPRSIRNPGKIFQYGNFIFLNEQNEGIHIIDNSQPTSPANVAFINIVGNVDMAVKGNTLYADSYGDLVAFDITNPKQAVAKKFLDNVFPHRAAYYLNNGNSLNPDSVQVIAEWIRKDTTVDCDTYQTYWARFYSMSLADAAGNFSSPQIGGIGGSMARFTIQNNYMYTVTQSHLKVFDVSTPQEPAFKSEEGVGWDIETIYPFKDKLFIGSTTGMFIYDVSNAGNPDKLSAFSHLRSCDPVVADDHHAFVTLRSGNRCTGFTNQLDILNINNLLAPSLVGTHLMVNPHGLAKDGDLLFICDGAAGLKVFDVSNVNDIKLIRHVQGIETYDVIAWQKKALVVAKNGLYQFDYTNPKEIKLISTIARKKN